MLKAEHKQEVETLNEQLREQREIAANSDELAAKHAEAIALLKGEHQEKIQVRSQLAAPRSDQEIKGSRTKCSQEKTCETWLGKLCREKGDRPNVDRANTGQKSGEGGGKQKLGGEDVVVVEESEEDYDEEDDVDTVSEALSTDWVVPSSMTRKVPTMTRCGSVCQTPCARKGIRRGRSGAKFCSRIPQGKAQAEIEILEDRLRALARAQSRPLHARDAAQGGNTAERAHAGGAREGGASAEGGSADAESCACGSDVGALAGHRGAAAEHEEEAKRSKSVLEPSR